MTGRELAESLNLPERGLIAVDGGPASVVAGYTVGSSSVLVQGDGQVRRPGSQVWRVRIDPRTPGDGPSYLVPSEIAGRFVPLVVPRVPDQMALESERSSWVNAAGKAALDDVTAELGYWPRAVKEDAESIPGAAAQNLGRWTGAAASTAIRGVTAVLGGAAGAFYGSLPWWVQVGIPVAVVGVGVAGAVAIVRNIRGPAAGA